MNRNVKTALKITATAVILLVLTAGVGVGYVWYMGQNEDPAAFQEPAKATGGARITERPKLPADAAIGASVQDITSPVVPGSNASVTVKTNPEATCSIAVTYNGTPAVDSGLVEKKADEYGIVSWAWTLPANAPLGNWPVEATCKNAKNTAVVRNDLRVVRTLE
jgi:hypothetical protein